MKISAMLARALFFAAALLLAPQPASARHGGGGSAGTHPALFTVHGPKGTAYLFGSIHVLPSGINWKTPEIARAMARADMFVFEIPLDHREQDEQTAQRIQKQIMDLHGLLPPGQSLRGMLPDKMVSQYDGALDMLSISPGYVDRLQPWLASMVLENAQLYRSDVRAAEGVDLQVFAVATALHKPSRGLETLEQQLALLTPEEQKSGMAELGKMIAECTNMGVAHKIDAMVASWARGDLKAVQTQTDSDFAKDPALKKTMLDDRNARWIPQIKAMLAENRTYFITVGAAHLVGPKGGPALLRAAGYTVDGPD